jgi:hypothetical protein
VQELELLRRWRDMRKGYFSARCSQPEIGNREESV